LRRADVVPTPTPEPLVFDSNDAAQAAAIAAAEDDLALLAALREREEERAAMTDEEREELAGSTFASASEALRPMNRAERRQAVKAYAAAIDRLPKARPLVNPTIVPKSKRRKRR
jgi:hypothetical protein